jgi:uncharacterized protein (TIGR00255 family)
MISSMTAFARQEQRGEWGLLSWQIRSINHRYLDLNINMPDAFLEFESQAREKIRAVLRRGKVDCTLYYQSIGNVNTLTVNTALLEHLLQVSGDIGAKWEKATTLNPLEVLRWPGILQTATTSRLDFLNDKIWNLLTQTLDELQVARLREGASLANFLQQHLAAMHLEIKNARQRLPEVQNLQRKRLLQRLEEAQVSFEPQRLEQEMVLFAQRNDVTEECERLETHVTEVERLLAQGHGVGRRLDFLMQELHREANTLGSKSLDQNLSRVAIELKILIEQMREQIQNIE